MSDLNATFLKRFRLVLARKRRVQLGQVCVSTLLLALVGLGLLAAADYEWELDRFARAAALSAVLAGVVLFAGYALWAMARRWGQPTTAAEIESAFPELGQSVRTTVQFGQMPVDEVQVKGVAVSLVTALAQETHRRALPLALEDIVPSRRLLLIFGGLIAGIVLLAGASSVDWEWRNATQRAVLQEHPYRQLEVQPGDQTVDEGAGMQVQVALIGRTNREVTFYTRPAEQPDAEWTERTLEEEGAQRQRSELPRSELPRSELPRSELPRSELPRATFVAKLDRLTKPLEYRVSAGELASPHYRIDIRRPLRIEELKVELTPPAYTGQPASSVIDANLSVLQGTLAQFEIKFDKPVKSASLIFAPRKQPLDDEPNEPEVVPLTLTSAALTSAALTSAALPLQEDRHYSIVAEAADGTRLAENKFRIRVREDQPPDVTFEEPNDAVEVHTLAELPMRVRVRDDFGLTKAGIVFQVNNEQEIPLVAQDFAVVVAAAEEAAATGKISPTTQAALEKILPLEHFELTQKDSVMYFAFAEDNLPDRPQRTETDMRFIDIRPFKREYRVIDPDPMPGMGMGGGLKSLEELIQRQRFALNRTLQIQKRAAVGRMPDANSLEQLMQFETDLAANVRDTAQGLEARGFDDTELFYQAEAAMLQAVDSLSVAKWENATLQMRDALKALIEQRDRTQAFILKNPNAALLAALRAFDRLQAQKLRRPKSDKEEARELIRRLEELVNQENAVVGALEDGEEKSEVGDQKPEDKGQAHDQ